ncbi:MAG: glycine--tRNA ligase subunit beta [Gammaproteobacteria bacterium]|nr:glycine--tRNA ligase subunit beta [Gammaproteobacteria bacterium]
MNEPRDLLIEIGTEELPPTALKRLAIAFHDGVINGLLKAQLNHGKTQWYATPRRLAILVQALVVSQQDNAVQRRGPALKAAFGDDGCATPAALGFAKSCGVAVDDLQRLETVKGAWLVHDLIEKGQQTQQLIPNIIATALDQLPIPKRMRWGALQAEFVRPVHWLVLLFGDEVINAELLSVKSGRETRGHRFHHPQHLYLPEPQDYAPLLETKGHVVADFDVRRTAIRAQIQEAANQLKGKAVIDEALLDEVTSMVEWPAAVTGSFEPRFLQVPPEVLVTTMKTHQKYFHLVDTGGKLLPYFITIANIESTNVAVIRAGNEKVVNPRLVDAEFFWNQDRAVTLESRLESLKTVVFQQKLGSLHDKVQRVAKLARCIAKDLGHDEQQAGRAGLLSKCDLMTDMVAEFPSLQGIMGRYYALHDKEQKDIAEALDEQYKPRFAGDALPQTAVGQALAVADKLDTLSGIFAIQQIPSGDKDPFALRRAALGVLRIIIEQKLDLDLKKTLELSAQYAVDQLKNGNASSIAQQCYDFMMERLRAYYLDSGTTADVFESVLVLRPAQPFDFDERIRAVSGFRRLPEAESLSAANKRIANILKKTCYRDLTINDSLLQHEAEKYLAEQLAKITSRVNPLFAKRQYQQALKVLAQLKEPVDQFFDDVMVMTDNEAQKNNRLALLGRLRSLFLQVADLSRLQN